MESEMMGVVVHCAHEFKRPYLPPPKHVKQLLTVRFHTRSYHRIIYRNNDDSPLITTHLHPCSPSENIYTRSRNPYCKSCMLEIVLFLLGHGYSLDDAIDEFSSFFYVVQHKINSMLQSYHHLNDDGHRNLKFNEVFSYEVRLIAPRRECDEVEYRALVADGEIFEPLVMVASARAISKLASIKGLEIVADVQELLANKEDDVCAICLDELLVIKKSNNKINNEEKEGDPTTIEQLKTHDYDDDDIDNGGNNNDDDNTTKKKLIVRLPCKHVFHQGCIGEWVQRNHICPCCRFRLAMDDA